MDEKPYHQWLSKIYKIQRKKAATVTVLLACCCVILLCIPYSIPAEHMMLSNVKEVQHVQGFGNGRDSLSGNTGYEPWYYYIAEKINAVNGNLFCSHNDISLQARGCTVELIRSYNSLNADEESSLGYGWTFNYNSNLIDNGDHVLWSDGDGSLHTFINNYDGTYTPPPGIHARLINNDDDTYTLWMLTGKQYHFDTTGTLHRITDKSNNTLTMIYTTSLLTRVIDDSGLYLDFTYDDDDHIHFVTDPLGRTIEYVYDPQGNLQEIIDPMGNASQIFYDDNHQLVCAVDRAGAAQNYTYTDGKVTDLSLSQFNTTTETFHHHLHMLSISYDDPLVLTGLRGYTTTVELNEQGNLVNITDALNGKTSLVWDDDMNLVQFTDARRNIYSFSYDSYGNLLNETDPLGNSTMYDHTVIQSDEQYYSRLDRITNALGATITYGYDDQGRSNRTTDAAGESCYRSYDTYGNCLSYTDFRGNTTTYSYDEHGHLLNSTDAVGNITQYSYDTIGRMITMTDANDHTATYEYNDNDKVTRIIDATGNTTYFYYNEEDSLIQTVDANGHETMIKSNLIGRRESVTDATGNETLLTYDAYGHLVHSTDARGEPTNITYDALYRITSVTDALGYTENYTYDAVGNVLTKIDKKKHATTYEYDSLNRLITKTDALNHQTRYTYDAVGNIINITDGNGNFTQYFYDVKGRLERVVDALGYETSYTYDKNDNTIAHTNPNNHTTYYEWDALNRVTKIISPLGFETQYRYDAVGNIINRTDANGTTTTYEYDELDRLIAAHYPKNKGYLIKYDAVGNVLQVDNLGGIGDITCYHYDALDRIINVTMDYGNFIKTIIYTYDENGNRKTMEDPDGGLTTYTYDACNQVKMITNPAGESITFVYDNAGYRTRLDFSNGEYTTYLYDAADRIINQTNWHPDGTILSSYAYTYDNLGNRLTMTETTVGMTTYGYDPLYRLTNVTYPSGTTVDYVFDGCGNQLQKIVNGTDSTYSTYDDDERLLTQGSISYVYDDNGNRIQKTEGTDVTQYRYDYENRLLLTILPDMSGVAHQYSPYGTRLKTNNRTTEKYYLYDFEDVLMELHPMGYPRATYTHGPRMDEPLMMSREGQQYYYHFDALGSVTSITDASSGIVVAYAYDVFGFITGKTGSLVNPYRFTAREYEEDTGLYYFRARQYDPEIGRFLQKDPLYIFLTDNLYVYCDDNPVNLVDPTGLLIWGLIGLAIAAAAIALAILAVIKFAQAIANSMKQVQNAEAANKQVENAAPEDLALAYENRQYQQKKVVESTGDIGEKGFGLCNPGGGPPGIPGAGTVASEAVDKVSEKIDEEDDDTDEDAVEDYEEKDVLFDPTEEGIGFVSISADETFNHDFDLLHRRINDVGLGRDILEISVGYTEYLCDTLGSSGGGSTSGIDYTDVGIIDSNVPDGGFIKLGEYEHTVTLQNQGLDDTISTIDFTIEKNEGTGPVTVLDEGFDDLWILDSDGDLAPPNWEVHHNGNQNPWHHDTVIEPAAAVSTIWDSPMPRLYDEWLVTDTCDMSQMNNAVLSFEYYNWLEPPPSTPIELQVWTSTNGETTPIDFLTTGTQIATVPIQHTPYWLSSDTDVSSVCGEEDVHFAFRVAGEDNVGQGGFIESLIDDVEVAGEGTTWTPVYSGTSGPLEIDSEETISVGFAFDYSDEGPGDYGGTFEVTPGGGGGGGTEEDDDDPSDNGYNPTYTVLDDDQPPEIRNVTDIPDPQLEGGFVNISCNVSDDHGVAGVQAVITLPDDSVLLKPMINIPDTDRYYINETYNMIGLHEYHIWAVDLVGNENESEVYNFTIVALEPLMVWVDDDYYDGGYNDGHIWGYDAFHIIQDGVDAVAEYGIVFVKSGTYLEHLLIDKTITLQGEHKETTVVDGQDSNDVIIVTADWVNISGFTIINGSFSGIYLDHVDQVHVNKTILTNHENGMYLDGCQYTDISAINASFNTDDGIEITGQSQHTLVQNSTFIHDGASVFINDATHNIIDYNYVADCTAFGIQLYNQANDNIISNNTIINTTDETYPDISGHGINIWEQGNTNHILGNTLSENIVGIYIRESSTANEIYHNTFTENTQNAYDACISSWDNGYPCGGNYWDDYTGEDLYRGPNQDILGADDIGDSCYAIPGGSNEDQYPLMLPWGETEFVLNLADFPMYEAEDPPHEKCGPTVAQMTLNYIWWNSTTDPDGPPMLFDDQQWLYDRGIENNTNTSLPYLDTQGLWKIIQFNKPEPYSEYGYNFMRYGDEDIHEILKRICLWVNYTIGTVGGYKPGHPLHVPALFPAYGDYSNWMAIRGIHTNKEAYPIQDDLIVHGFWVNDPYPGNLGGLGENSYKTIAQWLDTYYLQIESDDYYDGKYVAIFEPPETQDFTLHLAETQALFTPLQQQVLQLMKQTPKLHQRLTRLTDKWVIQAALEGVAAELLPYDEDFAKIFSQAQPGTPLYVDALIGEEYYIVPFNIKGAPSITDRTEHTTSILILVNAHDGSFQEASWVAQPVEYLPVSEQDAYQIAKRYCEEQGIALEQQWGDATLLYRQGSPYYPDWKLTMGSLIMYVAQDGSVTMAI